MCEVYDRAEQKGIQQGIKQTKDLDINIIRAIRRGKSIVEISKMYGVSKSSVKEIADAMTETLS